jgi:hypothetical protein
VLDVEVADLAPRGVEVDLGQDADHVGAHAPGGLQELELGGRELLAGVGHEHHRVGQRQRPDGGGAVGRAEPADTGGVDDDEAVGQQLARDRDLDRLDPALVGRVGRLGDVLGHLLDRDLLADRLGPLAVLVDLVVLGGLEEHRRPGFLGVAHRGRRRGGDVVVDRADRRVEQRVDQRRLPLLELAHHEDVERRVEQPLLREPQSVGQVGPLVRGRRLGPQVDHGERLLHRCRSCCGVQISRHLSLLLSIPALQTDGGVPEGGQATAISGDVGGGACIDRGGPR